MIILLNKYLFGVDNVTGKEVKIYKWIKHVETPTFKEFIAS